MDNSLTRDTNPLSVNAYNKTTLTFLSIKFEGRPDPPKDFANGVTDTSITVEWKEGFDGGYEQTFYIKVNKKKEKKVDSKCKIGNIWSYTCQGLEPGTKYNIEITAKNCKGSSKPCHLKYRTEGKPDPPTKFRIAKHGITDKSIMVEWEPGYDGGLSQTFFVFYKGIEHEVRSSPTNGSPYSFKCENLKPRSTYTIVLYAKNIKGNADSCILKDCKTKEFTSLCGKCKTRPMLSTFVFPGLNRCGFTMVISG
ncbi:cell adhesion molecule DSCAM-like [Ruditapes philippinarum]|uniref:cell adhesion molecule DSCAM-like n=1 Tax=Ruditapes philippinarum TaxID=129788 RepID=UPI00295B032D|nr:cell adhesion molecule DSCAM-like [Ruditapes philippinarum]